MLKYGLNGLYWHFNRIHARRAHYVARVDFSEFTLAFFMPWHFFAWVILGAFKNWLNDWLNNWLNTSVLFLGRV